jgi:hypothetical protein
LQNDGTANAKGVVIRLGYFNAPIGISP